MNHISSNALTYPEYHQSLFQLSSYPGDVDDNPGKGQGVIHIDAGQMTLGPKAKSREVPTAAELVVGDESKKGPSNLILTDNATIHMSPLVQSEIPNKNTSDLYIVEPVLNSKKTKPFAYMVRLKGKGGVVTNIKGLFDNGAMVNSICKTVYTVIKDKLGSLPPSS